VIELIERATEPVALVVWIMVAIAIVSWRQSQKGMFLMASISLAAFLMFSTPLGAYLMLVTLEELADSLPNCRYSAEGRRLVILGGNMEIDGVPVSDPSRLSRATLRRLIVGYSIAKSAPVEKIMVVGGGAVVAEAYLMRDVLVEMGLPNERIIVDAEPRSTYESAAAIARLLDAEGSRRRPLGLVTSASNMPLAFAAFRAQNLDVCPVTAEWRGTRPPVRFALIPHISALEKSTEALREVFRLIAYRLSGKL
jgi:uncharacterized SAM-binding protein YcdF (DUF218 family)